MRRNPLKIFLLACLLITPGCVFASDVAPVHADTSKAWLLHLPGISGETGIDHGLVRGLKQGGYDGAVEIYDWTGNSPGIPALLNHTRNMEQAQKIADKIAAHAHEHPDGEILLVSHSGGTGLAVWALEDLPADVKVDTLLLLSPALSPTYDLTKALSHVRHAYAFTSPNDLLVLGAGTSLFGTIDGKKCESAGKCGFERPDSGDKQQYAKLISRAYDSAWMKYGNIGDHIGSMAPAFAAAVLTPLLMKDLPALPATQPASGAQATTRPSGAVGAATPDCCDGSACQMPTRQKLMAASAAHPTTRPALTSQAPTTRPGKGS